MCLKTLKKIRKKLNVETMVETDMLIGKAIQQDRSFVLAHPEYRPNIWQRIKLFKYIKLFQHGWPFAYIVGHKEFYGLDFFVNKYTLIPRPDSEIIVDIALAELTKNNFDMLIDVGTGSGCIPIAITKKLQQKNITTIAIDISKKALKIATKNAKRHNADIKFFQGNLLEPIIKTKPLTTDKKCLITANLPYLTQSQFDLEPSIQREPRVALIADSMDGLTLYQQLFTQLKLLSSTISQPLTVIIEIDPRQHDKIIELAKKYFPNAKTEIKKDLSNKYRVLVIK